MVMRPLAVAEGKGGAMAQQWWRKGGSGDGTAVVEGKGGAMAQHAPHQQCAWEIVTVGVSYSFLDDVISSVIIIRVSFGMFVFVQSYRGQIMPHSVPCVFSSIST